MPPLQPHHRCDVLLVTVTDVETKSLFEIAKSQTNRDYTTLTAKHKTYFDLGEIGGARVFAVRSEMGTSTTGGSLVTVKDAIVEVKPSAVIMIGVAFGVNEATQNIGDILVSKQLQPYELQRVGTTERSKPKITLRGDKAHCSTMLLDRLRTTYLQWSKSDVAFGLVLSGEKLIDNVDFRNELLSLSEEAIGGEMEGGGLYVACQQNKVDWILVKAICDWADGKKGEGKKEKQKLAAMNAAEFVIAMLTAGLLETSSAESASTNLQTQGLQANLAGDRNVIIQGVAKNVTIITGDRTNVAIPSTPNPQPIISISRLPNMLTNDLFGREAELQLLDEAWATGANDKTNLICFVAFGGSGKSALVNCWLQQMAREGYRGAERVYAWSFWSQGTDQPQTSADPFIDAALRCFGDPEPTAGSPWDKGERLARLIKQSRTLLILDGIEPLQHPRATMEGRLKEQSMQALLKELAGGQLGLCVISTREHIADLKGFVAPAVIAHDLDQLSPAAGAEILRQQNLKGSDKELKQASKDFGNHALALTILASFLHNAYDGDIRKRKEIGPLTDDELNGGHARRVMTTYETWLRDAGDDTLLAVLRLLGLFNRPADAASLATLRAAPAIPDLTEALLPLTEPQWKQTLAKLRRLKLLTESSTNGEVDAHAILREHFRDQLQRAHPAAWREGNLCLYEHLTHTAKDLPDTLEEMQPLFAAVTHGCAAGLQQQTWDDVYRRRIQRGDEYFGLKKLGAVGADLAALSGFFTSLWNTPSALLNIADQALALSTAGFDLWLLGRLPEARQPTQAGLELQIIQEDWRDASKIAGNLSELNLMLGYLSQSLAYAQRSVEFAERSSDGFMCLYNRTILADAMHQAGRLTEAADEFCAAEILQQERQKKFPFLYSVQGFRYRDLMLSQGQFQKVQTRATQMLEGEKEGWLLDIALDQLALGRAHLGLAQQADGSAPSVLAQHLAQAADWLDCAVDGLQQAGDQSRLPRGLLARAAWARVAQQYDQAHRDLADARAIAERGEMRLHLTDYHLESARLALVLHDALQARVHYDAAQKLIDETGYHRRDGELQEIEVWVRTAFKLQN